MNLTELPTLLTVEEAAEILRLKRSQAYELTRIYRLSGGTRGLPVVVFGRWLRVPKAAILHFSEDVTGDARVAAAVRAAVRAVGESDRVEIVDLATFALAGEPR